MSRVFFKVDEKDIARKDYCIVDDDLYDCENVRLSAFFDTYDVPQKYRFLFFYKSLINDDIKEFFTDMPLSFVRSTEDKRFYQKNVKYDDNYIYCYIIDKTDCNYDKNTILDFFFKLDENNYIDRYLKALNDYFMLHMDLYNVNRVSDSDDLITTKRKYIKRLAKLKKINMY